METQSYDKKYQSQVVNLWNRCLVADPINEETFLKKVILDENFSNELCRIYVEENSVKGFIWAVKRKYPYGERGFEENRGWIVLFFVDPEWRRQGIGSSLIKETEQKLKELNTKQITIAAYSPNYLFPGVDYINYPDALIFLEKFQYDKKSEAVSMAQNLVDFRLTETYLSHKKVLIDLGYKLDKFQLSESENLIDFLQKNFPGGWATNVKNAILGNRAEDTILILKNKEDKIVGYCQRAIDGNPSRFGPFGVQENLRGLKLGMYLFNEMLFDMLKNQIYYVYFLWTSGSAQKFYEKNGMRVYREYRLMNKNI